MTDFSIGHATRANLRAAVHRSTAWTREGLLERLFTLAFRGLVYAQIWEDPAVDLEALQLRPTDHLVTIASGGCNAMSYLIADPARVTALDLNGWHVALLKLRQAGALHMPEYEAFRAFFGDGNRPENPALFDRFLAQHLDAETLAFWTTRDWLGRRRIELFARGFHRHGLLGRCIAAGHVLARVNGADPRILLAAKNREEQAVLFERELAPIFDRPLVRALFDMPASLYGLGIPPAQYEALTEGGRLPITQVLRERLRRLACDFDFADNYFAQQAFGRSYADGREAALPPYLQPGNFDAVRARADRIAAHHGSVTDFLAQSPAASVDAFVLLDAQDWMAEADLTALWREITRTARPGARVIFRTAADERLLPGRVPDPILAHWSYDEARCRALHARDRSAVYGGFHLYEKTMS